MSWFNRSYNRSAALERYALIAGKLHSELQYVFNNFDSKFLRMSSAEKLAVLTSIRQKLNRLQLFSDVVSEKDVPIKVAYNKILKILFEPHGESYFDFLDKFANHANISASEVDAKEKILLKQLFDELSLIDDISGSTNYIEKQLLNSSKSLSRVGKSSLIHAALISLILLTNFALTSAQSQISSDNISIKTREMVNKMFNPQEYLLDSMDAKRLLKLGNDVLNSAIKGRINPNKGNVSWGWYQLGTHVVEVYAPGGKIARISINYKIAKINYILKYGFGEGHSMVCTYEDPHDSLFIKTIVKEYNKTPVGQIVLAPPGGFEASVWLHPMSDTEIKNMLNELEVDFLILNFSDKL